MGQESTGSFESGSSKTRSDAIVSHGLNRDGSEARGSASLESVSTSFHSKALSYAEYLVHRISNLFDLPVNKSKGIVGAADVAPSQNKGKMVTLLVMLAV